MTEVVPLKTKEEVDPDLKAQMLRRKVRMVAGKHAVPLMTGCCKAFFDKLLTIPVEYHGLILANPSSIDDWCGLLLLGVLTLVQSGENAVCRRKGAVRLCVVHCDGCE